MKQCLVLGLAALASCQVTEDAKQLAPTDLIDVADAALVTTGLTVEQDRLLNLQHLWQARIAVVLDNLANVATPGFKRRVVHIESLPMMTVAAPGPRQNAGGTAAPVGVQVGGGAAITDVFAIFSQGALEITQRNLDIAIEGAGFFATILLDGSSGYTRGGSLQLNQDGVLCSASGAILQPQISVPADLLAINIDPEGRVSGRTAGSPDTQTHFGQLLVHDFVNPSGLRDIGGSTWRQTEASGAPATGQPGTNGLGLLRQGFLERSNVDLAHELARLNTARRQYAAIARALER